ncbi:MAG: glycosyltransferase family 2 protein [Candidatus Obscuribacterales bacterium]|nr:glycosyltransferase family 2 protein [Candidatus Obscuribacterales bacterium]
MTNAGVSCAICTLNGASRIEKCLERLAANVDASVPWEIIVVDNGSSDDTINVAMSAWKLADKVPIRVISVPQPDIRQARLQAIDQAKFSLVSFIDDDNWVPANWVDEVFQSMQANLEAGALGVASRGVFDRDPPDWFKRQKQRHAVGEQIYRGQGWMWSAGLTVRKDAVRHILDSGFEFSKTEGYAGRKPGSDVELTIFMTLAGWKLLYSDKLALDHHIAGVRVNASSVKGLARAQGMAHPNLEPLIAATSSPRVWERLGLTWEHGMAWGALRLGRICFRLLMSGSESDLADLEFWQGYLTVMAANRLRYIARIKEARRFSSRAQASRSRYIG